MCNDRLHCRWSLTNNWAMFSCRFFSFLFLDFTVTSTTRSQLYHVSISLLPSSSLLFCSRRHENCIECREVALHTSLALTSRLRLVFLVHFHQIFVPSKWSLGRFSFDSFVSLQTVNCFVKKNNNRMLVSSMLNRNVKQSNWMQC